MYLFLSIECRLGIVVVAAAVAIAMPMCLAANSPNDHPHDGPPGLRGADWPRFLGPTGNGKSPETGILTRWGANGPPVVWHRRLGTGYGIGSAAGRRFFQFDRYDDQARLTCLDARTGKLLWKFE